MSDCNNPPACMGELAGLWPANLVQPGCDFAEGKVWEKLGGGWHSLCGGYCEHGLSVEWHDFTCETPRDWSRSFHPCGLEVCLNVSGHARLSHKKDSLLVGPLSVCLYTAPPASPDQRLSAWRLSGERHRFLTLELSPGFLKQHLGYCESDLHPVVRQAMRPRGRGALFSQVSTLTPGLRKCMDLIRTCPLSGHSATLWFQGKALELASNLFFKLPEAPEATNSRSKETARRRVARAVEALSQRLADPPGLDELGRIVGCSPYYLSRTFSRQMGMTIPQYLRQIRMERAADLLKSGKFNVTEAALEVGYNSLSHFSHAFCEVIGCCPGLYPLGVPRPIAGVPSRVPAVSPAPEEASELAEPSAILRQ